MKLNAISRNRRRSVYSYLAAGLNNLKDETESPDNTEPLDSENETTDIPDNSNPKGKDMGNRLPSGGRTGNPKIDKFQGFRIPPMY